MSILQFRTRSAVSAGRPTAMSAEEMDSFETFYRAFVHSEIYQLKAMEGPREAMALARDVVKKHQEDTQELAVNIELWHTLEIDYVAVNTNIFAPEWKDAFKKVQQIFDYHYNRNIKPKGSL